SDRGSDDGRARRHRSRGARAMRKRANGEWRMAIGKRRRRPSPIRYSLFAAAMAAAPPTYAQNAAPCATVAEAEQIATVFGGRGFVTLTPAQAAVARSMFTIATLGTPPGDE